MSLPGIFASAILPVARLAVAPGLGLDDPTVAGVFAVEWRGRRR